MNIHNTKAVKLQRSDKPTLTLMIKSSTVRVWWGVSTSEARLPVPSLKEDKNILMIKKKKGTWLLSFSKIITQCWYLTDPNRLAKATHNGLRSVGPNTIPRLLAVIWFELLYDAILKKTKSTQGSRLNPLPNSELLTTNFSYIQKGK